MMNLLNETIIPFKGTNTIKLGMSLSEIRAYLKDNKIPFNQTMDSNKYCTPPIPWIYITVEKSLSMSFVDEVLFEISFENEYMGKLPNGIGIGNSMEELEKQDSSLEYNDDDECFVSAEGYWIIDDIDTGKVQTITIYLEEVNSEEFFEYEWTKKYKK
ncbi:MAG TPA: hypothetical protein DCP07_07320 [Lachnospiraceae bacterium]|nr:hypothetical protein [Lachnospiraceae bacterium]